MAYKQKGFPMHSVSALKVKPPRKMTRKEPGMMRRDHEEYLDTRNPTTLREIERMEAAVREQQRDPMAEMRRKKQQGLMDGPVKPPVYDVRKGTETSEERLNVVPSKDSYQQTINEKRKAGMGYETTYKRDEDGNIIESGITFDDGTYLKD